MGEKTLDAVLEDFNPEKFGDLVNADINEEHVNESKYLEAGHIFDSVFDQREQRQEQLKSSSQLPEPDEDNLPAVRGDFIEEALDMLYPKDHIGSHSAIALDNLHESVAAFRSSIDKLVVAYEQNQKTNGSGMLAKIYHQVIRPQPIMTQEQLDSNMEYLLHDAKAIYSCLIIQNDKNFDELKMHYDDICSRIEKNSDKLNSSRTDIIRHTQGLRKIKEELKNDYIGRKIDYKDSKKLKRFYALKSQEMNTEMDLSNQLNDFLVTNDELHALRDDAALIGYYTKINAMISNSYRKAQSETIFTIDRAKREKSIGSSLEKSTRIANTLFGTVDTIFDIQKKISDEYHDEFFQNVKEYQMTKKANEVMKRKTVEGLRVDNLKKMLSQGRDSMIQNYKAGSDVYE